MKVYLAHNYAAKDYLCNEIAPQLVQCGIEVTSRWIGVTWEDPYQPNVQADEAEKDVQDVLRANCLLMFTDQYGDRPGRGKYVELGIAIAARKKIVLIGKEHSNTVFYFLPTVQHCATFEEALRVLTDHMYWMQPA